MVVGIVGDGGMEGQVDMENLRLVMEMFLRDTGKTIILI
jgi:hypothetical protein